MKYLRWYPQPPPSTSLANVTLIFLQRPQVLSRRWPSSTSPPPRRPPAGSSRPAPREAGSWSTSSWNWGRWTTAYLYPSPSTPAARRWPFTTSSPLPVTACESATSTPQDRDPSASAPTSPPLQHLRCEVRTALVRVVSLRWQVERGYCRETSRVTQMQGRVC